MEGVNPFIKNNKHRMIMFLDELGVRTILFEFPVNFPVELRWRRIDCHAANSTQSTAALFKELLSDFVCRMFVNSLKPQSTLGRTCPETWLHCTSSAPHTQMNFGR